MGQRVEVSIECHGRDLRGLLSMRQVKTIRWRPARESLSERSVSVSEGGSWRIALAPSTMARSVTRGTGGGVGAAADHVAESFRDDQQLEPARATLVAGGEALGAARAVAGGMALPHEALREDSRAVALERVALIHARVEYSVVVLPEPVRPVTSTMPWLREACCLKHRSMSWGMPGARKRRRCGERAVSSRRTTTRSP
jgi:hypothetical protein